MADVDERADQSTARAGVVIPAHNEEAVIPRLLRALQDTPEGWSFDLVVVCNGCSDGTAGVAREFVGAAAVIDIPAPSKKAALRVGDDALHTFPRVYIDADVEISGRDVAKLVDAISDGYAAAGPERVLPLAGSTWPVRSYYRVWQTLPQVRSGLFGRGVIALSKSANDRVRALPQVMSDDLAISEEFGPDERLVVPGSTVVVRPPRTLRDLVARRVRVATGNAEIDRLKLRESGSRTSVTTVIAMVRKDVRLAPHIPVFLAVTVWSKFVARRAIRRGDFDSWRRDESSRR